MSSTTLQAYGKLQNSNRMTDLGDDTNLNTLSERSSQIPDPPFSHVLHMFSGQITPFDTRYS